MTTLVGQPPFRYEARADWDRRPAGYTWKEVAGVATDSRDRVYVFNRGDHPLLIFDRDGAFLTSWGEGEFHRPHGITIGPDDAVYLTDDFGHTVRKYTTEGRLLMTLGTGQPSDTGATSVDYRTIRRAGPPFHYPTNVALAANGDLFISDGYGNARIHHFTPDGRLLKSWGEPGAGPGQFHIPHGLAIDRDGLIYVADRENSRIQIFTQHGEFVSERTEIARPCQVAFDAAGNLYVAEVGYRAGMWPGTHPPHENPTGGRISIFAPDGRLLSRWGGGDDPTAPGDFFAPHDLCLDSRGDVYLGEVVWSAGASRGIVPLDCHALQKFRLVG
jgi:DNA-binding beta-propeller fold protein YncE